MDLYSRFRFDTPFSTEVVRWHWGPASRNGTRVDAGASPLGITHLRYQTTRKNRPHILGIDREPLATLQTENLLGRQCFQPAKADKPVDAPVPGCRTS